MLVVQVVIARDLGVDDAGRIATGLTALAVLAVLGRYGVDQLILRRVATTPESGDVGREYAAGMLACLPFLGGLALVLALMAPDLAEGPLGDARSAGPLRWMALALPAFGVVAVQGEALKAVGAPFWGAFVQSLVGPIVTLGLLASPGVSDSLTGAAAALAAGFLASAVVAHLAWRRVGPRPRWQASGVRDLLGESWPFFGASILTLALTYAPVVALAVAAGPDDVARFFAADRWTQVPTMLLVAVNATVGPRFARLWASGEQDAARALLWRTSRATAVLAIAVGLALVVGAPWLIGAFGDGFEGAVPALRIMGVAQVVVLALGPVTSLLVMSGGERHQRLAYGFAAIVSVALCAALVPAHGLVGAAAAGSVAFVVSRFTILLMVTHRLSAPSEAR